MIGRVILFLVINFAGIGLGASFMGNGAKSNWYESLNKAPWTPPGWVFGAVWTLVMVCFAVYMAYRYADSSTKALLISLFTVQWLLNFAWNPIFFKFHAVVFGLIVISALTILVGYLLFSGFQQLKLKSLLILPYFAWLLIATSLNAYILIKN